jgi:uncharacterized protein YutE (UPF0331/DUF86 family)
LTDQELIAKKLAFIEACVREIRSFARPEEIRTDILQQRFIEHTLQIAIQAALDVSAHIVSDENLGEPRTNRDLFEILIQHGWLPEDLDTPLRGMVGFRNILVHGYEVVDLAIVEDVVHHHLSDLLAFVRAIRERVARA